jgi:hypothetical protein
MVFGNIGSGVGNIVGGVLGTGNILGGGGDRQRRAGQRAIEDIGLPEFDFSSVSAPVLRQIAQQRPEAFQAILASQDPALLGESAEGRGGQAQALAQAQQIAAEGLPDLDRLRVQGLQDQIAQASSRQNEAVLSDLRRRGQSSGAAEAVARLQANQSAANQAAEAGRNIQEQSILNRLRGIDASAGQAGALRAGDQTRGLANQSAQNRFNEFVSQLQTGAAGATTAAQNQAQAANAADAQRIADANAINAKQAQLGNIDRQNQLRGATFDAEAQKQGALANAFIGRANAADAAKAGRQKSVTGIAGGVGGLVGGAADVFGAGGGFGSGGFSAGNLFRR